MSLRPVIISLGAVATLIGLIFMFLPLQASSGYGCGNALIGPDINQFMAPDGAEELCTVWRIDRWSYVAPMFLGGLALIGSSVVGTSAKPSGHGPANEESVKQQ